jgi:glycosyltransferase involved in cell wall biosynthesis
MIRVGVVTEQLRRPTPGGIGRYAQSLVDSLRSLPLASEITVDEVQGRRLPTELTSKLWSLGVRIPVSAQVLHATSFAWPQTIPRRPTTVFVHDLLWRNEVLGAGALNERGRRFHDNGLRNSMRAEHIFVPAHSVAQALIADGVRADQVTVTGEGADHLPVRVRTEREPYLLSVGTFQPRKNLGRLLAAYTELRTRHAGTPALTLVGSDNWRGVAGLPSELPAGVNVVTDVSDDALADLYAGATAFVFPSLGEGYGLPPLEAMRAGVPTICSPMPSISEPVGPDQREAPTNPQHVALVDPTSVESLVGVMERVLTSVEYRSELVHYGTQWAGERTWRSTAQRHLDVWKELV